MNSAARMKNLAVVAVAALGLSVCGQVTLVPVASAAAVAATVTVDGMNLDRGGTAVINDLEREEIAPGLVHVKYERLGADGWQQINILKASLSDSTVNMRYLTPSTVAGPGATVTEMVEDGGAIAGVNLDRFDINNSWAAAGWGIQDGQIVKSGNPDASASVGVDAQGLGALVNLVLEGSVVFADRSALAITGVNVYAAPVDGISLFNATWGDYSRSRVVGSPEAGVEVLVGADGAVLSVSDRVGAGQLAAGEQSLVASAGSAAGARLAALAVGDVVDISYGVNEDNLDIQQAGGAWHRLLDGGQPVPFDPTGDHFVAVNPRTMIGFSEDRRTAYFVVVDGRTAVAKGMGFAEQIRLMQDLGAHDAINADGGGSSQMNVRPVGEGGTSVSNSPSDGYERLDGDGMGLVLAQPGSGVLESFAVRPASDTDEATRVFPGFHRTLVGLGYDETLSPVPVPPTGWSSSDRSVATVADGVVTGVSRGGVTVRASRGIAEGAAQLQVLGTPTRLSVDQNVVNLETLGSSSILTFTGHDDQGFTAPIEASDLQIDNPAPETFSVQPTEDGRVKVTAIGAQGSATLTVRSGDLEVQVAVAVPLEVRLIDDFADISGWSTAHDRAAVGGIEPGEGHEGSPSIRLNYDFTDSTATRGRYAVAPGAVTGGNGGIAIPGRPQKLSVWVKGDGKGSLLRLQVMQANGVRNWIDGPGGSQSLHATWTGWERQDFVVPSSFAFPLKLERIRALETVAAKQYAGSLEFSKIYAYLPPDGVTAPEVERVEDPVVVEADGTDESPLRVAVMSDAQFVARDPQSGAVEGAREALREIVAEDPDLMVINGDFVDEASVEDFALARTILDEELAGVDFPWYYVPGNHEIMGASISNFQTAFGETSHVFDAEGTRFVTLSSATGVLSSDFAQVRELRTQLDEAAADPAITGVVLLTHMPTDDPLPTNGSQLTDRNEAELVDDWLQEFRSESGKSVAYIAGHVGVFHASSIDGVPYVINGNSGKSPASTPEDGGFTGWTMLGIDPADGRWVATDDAGADWLAVEVKTRVDTLTVTAPTAPLGVGQVFETEPLVVQDGDREVPVDWPSSFRWTGSDGVFVGAAADAPDSAIAAIDPSTHEIEALRAGSGSVTLEVNDVTETVDFTVVGGDLALQGEGVYGKRLTASVGRWADGARVDYTWLRDGVPISGATGSSYDVVLADLGTVLSVQAVVSGEGRVDVTVRTSLTGPAVAAQQPAPAASLAGDATVGSMLHAVTGDWLPGTALTFAWQRDGVPVAGRSSAYSLTAADLGHRLEAQVTGYLAGYEPASVTSAPSALVGEQEEPPTEEPAPEVVASAQPVVVGVPRVGAPLGVVLEGWEPGAVFAYQWLRDGIDVPGADGRVYRPVAADRGSRFSIRVLGSIEGRISVVRTSAVSEPAALGSLGARPTPRIAGQTTKGAVLRVRTGNWEDGVRLSYTWYRKGVVVRTATGPQYRLRAADVGKRIRVRVTAAKPGYASVVRFSASTKVVRR